MNPMMQQQQGQDQFSNPEEDMMEEDGMEMEGEGSDMPMIDGEQLQMLLFDRVRQLSPQEMQVLDSIITPQTVPVLFKLFPELGILFDMGSQLQGMNGGSGQGQEQEQGQPQMGQAQQPNPLSNPNVSRGLSGF